MKKSVFLIALLTCTLYHSSVTIAQSTDLDWINRTMDRYMAKNDIPALAAGIVRDGRVEAIIPKGTMSRKSTRAIQESTQFQIASLSKTFTGLIASHLAAEGRIDLQASITDYLPPSVSGAVRQQMSELTLRDVLHHHAGLPHNGPSLQPTPGGQPLTRPYTEQDLIKDLNNLQLKANQPASFSYSNFGYGLAGYLLEQASGRTYEQLLQTYVAEQIDMSHTTSLLTNVRQDQLPTPYMPHRRKKATQAWVFGKLAPAGGLFSTIPDLCRLMIRQIEAYRKYGQTEQAGPYILTQDKRPMDKSGHTYYGYGMIESRNTADTTILQLQHSGDVDGFVSSYRFSPTRGVGLVLLSSSGGTWFWELERMLNMKLLGLPIRKAVSVDKKVLKRYVGKYDFGHLVMTISRRGDQLYTQTPGFPKQKLYPEAENKFFYHAFDGQIEFVLNPKREIEKVIYTQNGRTAYPKKVK